MTTKDHPAPQPSGVEKDVLKPCPFCGGDATLEQIERPYGLQWSVGCRDEDCVGYQSLTAYGRKAEASAAWNRRHPPAPAAGGEACGACGFTGDRDLPTKVDALELENVRLTEERDHLLKWLETGLTFGKNKRAGDDREHMEWHAKCGCAYHPEPFPHVHPCSDAHKRPDLHSGSREADIRQLHEKFDKLAAMDPMNNEASSKWRAFASELIAILERPAGSREPPHCPTCDCAARLK